MKENIKNIGSFFAADVIISVLYVLVGALYIIFLEKSFNLDYFLFLAFLGSCLAHYLVFWFCMYRLKRTESFLMIRLSHAGEVKNYLLSEGVSTAIFWLFLVVLFKLLFQGGIANILIGLVVYVSTLFLRWLLFHLFSLSKEDSELGKIVFGFIGLVIVILTFILIKDKRGSSEISGLEVLTWAVPTSFSVIQEKIVSQISLERNTAIRLKLKFDVFASLMNILFYFLLLILSFRSLNTKGQSFLDYISENVTSFALSLLILVAFIVIVAIVVGICYKLSDSLSSYLSGSEKRIICVSNVISIFVICAILLFFNSFFDVGSNQEDVINILVWSFPLFVPTIIKKLPMIIEYILPSQSSILSGRSYQYFNDIVEINLFIVVFLICATKYIWNFYLINNLCYLAVVIFLSHCLTFICSKFIAPEISEAAGDVN